MQYKVPQDVQREDQILWFITLRQLIMLMVGFGISYMIFVKMKQQYDLNTVEMIFIWLPAAIMAAFAFLKIKGIELFHFVSLIVEQIFFRNGKRYWIAGAGEPFVSTTVSVKSLNKKNVEENFEKTFDSQKAEQLAEFLDQEKSSFQKQKSQNA